MANPKNSISRVVLSRSVRLKIIIFMALVGMSGTVVSQEITQESPVRKSGIGVDCTPILERVFSGTNPTRITTISLVSYKGNRFRDIDITPTFRYSKGNIESSEYSASFGLGLAFQFGKRIFQHRKFGVLMGPHMGGSIDRTVINTESNVGERKSTNTSWNADLGVVIKLEYWLNEQIAFRTDWPLLATFNHFKNKFDPGNGGEFEQKSWNTFINIDAPQIIELVYLFK